MNAENRDGEFTQQQKTSPIVERKMALLLLLFGSFAKCLSRCCCHFKETIVWCCFCLCCFCCWVCCVYVVIFPLLFFSYLMVVLSCWPRRLNPTVLQWCKSASIGICLKCFYDCIASHQQFSRLTFFFFSFSLFTTCCGAHTELKKPSTPMLVDCVWVCG